MIATTKAAPEPKAMRALRQWAFNTNRRPECPEDAATILNWLSRNTKPVSALADPDLMRRVFDAAGTLLDGRPASAWTAQGNRAILANALDYAVERKLIGLNPVKTARWKPPKATQDVDRRCVVNHAQARRLLTAVREQSPSGPGWPHSSPSSITPDCGPEEAVNLRKDDIILPPLVRNNDTGGWEEPADNWGELRFCSAAPEAGAEWTNDGTRRDQRHLKSRPVGEWRQVPSRRRSPGLSALIFASSAPDPLATSLPASKAANSRRSPTVACGIRRAAPLDLLDGGAAGRGQAGELTGRPAVCAA